MYVSIDIIDRIAATLLIAAEQRKCQSEISQQLRTVEQLVHTDFIRNLLQVQKLPSRYKAAFLKMLQGLDIHVILYRFLHFLIVKHNLGYIVQHVLDQYFSTIKKKQGIITVQVRFAGELTKSMQEKISKQLGVQKYDKVQVEFLRDDRLLYGMQIFREGYVLDLSGRMKLLKLQSTVDVATSMMVS